MEYKVVITFDAESDLDCFLKYLLLDKIIAEPKLSPSRPLSSLSVPAKA